MNRLNPISTHGRYGALNTNRPRNASRVSGLRRDQMYTSVWERLWPKNGTQLVKLLRVRSETVLYSSSQEKVAGEGPEVDSRRRL